ncbi:hypothetical protein ABBQ32_014074 [Trebouxia sp. C0010 RCD-2024]
MPCVHCASRDTALIASTSSRCSTSVPVQQRVFQRARSYKQLRRQLRRSRTAVQRACFQGNTHPRQQTQQVNTGDPRPFAQQRPALTQTPQQLGRCMVQGFAAATVLTFLAPGASYSAESLPIGLLKSWIEQVESLGPVVGPLIFILTMASAEMIPLFPTQPLSLASGLLFGPVQGTFCVICGTGLAAITAFSISRGVGKKLAERVVTEELNSESSEQSAMVESKFQGIQEAIDKGSFTQQSIAVAVLRLTPVVPFSASNYLLGMTPLELPAFMTGTVAGMTVWGVVYASLGGASRSLLKSGVDPEQLFSDLASKASEYTEDAIVVAAVLGLAAGAYYAVTVLKTQRSKELEEAEALRQERELASQSPVRRVQRLVQRLKGNA